MKTTVEIPDALFRQAKRYAAARNLTFRQVLESGLRKLFREVKAPQAFRLKKCAFRGHGLAGSNSWSEIRSIINHGRGE